MTVTAIAPDVEPWESYLARLDSLARRNIDSVIDMLVATSAVHPERTSQARPTDCSHRFIVTTESSWRLTEFALRVFFCNGKFTRLTAVHKLHGVPIFTHRASGRASRAYEPYDHRCILDPALFDANNKPFRHVERPTPERRSNIVDLLDLNPDPIEDIFRYDEERQAEEERAAIRRMFDSTANYVAGFKYDESDDAFGRSAYDHASYIRDDINRLRPALPREYRDYTTDYVTPAIDTKLIAPAPDGYRMPKTPRRVAMLMRSVIALVLPSESLRLLIWFLWAHAEFARSIQDPYHDAYVTMTHVDYPVIHTHFDLVLTSMLRDVRPRMMLAWVLLVALTRKPDAEAVEIARMLTPGLPPLVPENDLDLSDGNALFVTLEILLTDHLFNFDRRGYAPFMDHHNVVGVYNTPAVKIPSPVEMMGFLAVRYYYGQGNSDLELERNTRRYWHWAQRYKNEFWRALPMFMWPDPWIAAGFMDRRFAADMQKYCIRWINEERDYTTKWRIVNEINAARM